MKKFLVNYKLLLAAIALWIVALFGLYTKAHAQTATVGQIHKSVASAGTPERVSASTLLVRKAWFQYSASNTGTTGYVGNSAANAVAAKGIVLSKPTGTIPVLPFEIGSVDPKAPRIDLKEIWVDVSTNSDEVNIFYVE